MRLVAVVLNGHQTHYSDTKTLLDFGFANFYSVNVSSEDTTYSSLANDMTIAGLPAADLSILHLQDDSRITLPNNATFADTTSSISYELPASAPDRAVAQITYGYGGHDAGYTWLLRASKLRTQKVQKMIPSKFLFWKIMQDPQKIPLAKLPLLSAKLVNLPVFHLRGNLGK